MVLIKEFRVGSTSRIGGDLVENKVKLVWCKKAKLIKQNDSLSNRSPEWDTCFVIM